MKTLQKGFTLIELMIVVAIIGILAAIAVPAYQDYTIKSKVSESASLMAATKTALEVAYSEGNLIANVGTLPRQTLGLAADTDYRGKYVSYVTYGQRDANSIYIEVLLRDQASAGPIGLGEADGDIVRWWGQATGGNIQWSVAPNGGGAVDSTVPQKYLPKN